MKKKMMMTMMSVPNFVCHPVQAFFAQRGIRASRAVRRVLCDAIIARLARILITLSHYSRIMQVLTIRF
jgi:hypothetical protein